MDIVNNKYVNTVINSISGKITYNGKVINVPSGSRLEMADGKVLINGKSLAEYNEADCPIIKIEITGSAKSIETTNGDVTVKGNVTSIETMSGSVHCQTVEGNVSTMSGSVTCANIEGDCSTMCGSIMR